MEKTVLKGSRWLLLKAPENLKAHQDRKKDERVRLQAALELNQPLATAYYMKERLRLLFQCIDRDRANTEPRRALRKNGPGAPGFRVAQDFALLNFGFVRPIPAGSGYSKTPPGSYWYGSRSFSTGTTTASAPANWRQSTVRSEHSNAMLTDTEMRNI